MVRHNIRVLQKGTNVTAGQAMTQSDTVLLIRPVLLFPTTNIYMLYRDSVLFYYAT